MNVTIALHRTKTKKDARESSDPHCTHGVLRAIPSMTDAEVTTMGRSGPPPGPAAASFSRSRTDRRSSRSRSRFSVRGRLRLPIDRC